MSAAEARRPAAVVAAPGSGWPARSPACSLARARAAARGLQDRAAVRLQRRRERHFVPRAIGMFGHSLNPDYFVNPPAFTYLLHAAVRGPLGRTRRRVGGAFAADPTTAFAIARALRRPCSARSPSGCWRSPGARLFDDRRVGARRRRAARGRVPARALRHFALNDVPTLAPLCLALVGVAGIYRAGRLRDYALAGRRASAWPARPSTPAGIVLLPLLVAAALGRRAPRRPLGDLALAGVPRARRVPGRQPVRAARPPRVPRRAEQAVRAASATSGGKLGLADSSGSSTTSATLTWGLGWLPCAGRARRRGRAASRATGGWRCVLVPAPSCCSSLLGQQDALLRALAAADLSAAVPARGVGR